MHACLPTLASHCSCAATKLKWLGLVAERKTEGWWCCGSERLTHAPKTTLLCPRRVLRSTVHALPCDPLSKRCRRKSKDQSEARWSTGIRAHQARIQHDTCDPLSTHSDPDKFEVCVTCAVGSEQRECIGLDIGACFALAVRRAQGVAADTRLQNPKIAVQLDRV